MADSTSVLATLLLTTLQSAKEAAANNLFNASSPADLYANNPATTTGLTWGYIGGRLAGITIANGTVALTLSTTNYVVAARATGVVSVSTATTNWNDAANYLRTYSIVTGASTITSYLDFREAIGAITSTFTGGTLASALNEAPIVTVASGATTNIFAAAANTVSISGTTNITAFDTAASGFRRRIIFEGVLTFTHNATSLILPTGANIITAAGDSAEVVSLGSGNARVVSFQRKDGTALAASASGISSNAFWDVKGDLAVGTGSDTAARLAIGANGTVLTADSAETTGAKWAAPVKVIQLAVSDETTALTTGNAKVTFRMPHAMTLTAVRASLSTAQASGSIFTVDINEAGTTVISTKITIDNTEKTSTTAVTPPVISDAALADDAEITIDIDQVGDGTAKGLKVTLIGT